MANTDTGKTPNTAANAGKVQSLSGGMSKAPMAKGDCAPKALGTPVKGFTGGGVMTSKVGVKF